MILRPIVCYFEVSIDRTSVQPLLRIATGLHIESLFVQLSRCSGFPALLPFGEGVPVSVFVLRTLKAIQTQNANLQQLPMRRCASTDLPRGNSACSATLLPCFIRPVAGLWTIECLATLFRIDHRMNPLCFHFGLLLRKEVIQPHLPIRLPCYDFTPVIGLALDG